MSNKKNLISRKQFLAASAGAITGGLLGFKIPNLIAGEAPRVVLGKTGLKVSPICYGVTRVQEPALVKAGIDRGINFFDTGRSYGNGLNEVMLGKALKGVRDQHVIQSKMQINIKDEDLDQAGIDDKIRHIMKRSLDETLRALGSDYVDIMLVHNAQSERLLFHETVLEFLNKAKSSGSIRAIGFSTHNDHMDFLGMLSENPVFDTIMVPYNHQGAFTHSVAGYHASWDQEKLEELLKKVHDMGVGTVAMKTCSGGTTSLSDGEPSYRDAIQWVIKQPFIDAAAVAMTSFEQIEANLPQ